MNRQRSWAEQLEDREREELRRETSTAHWGPWEQFLQSDDDEEGNNGYRPVDNFEKFLRS